VFATYPTQQPKCHHCAKARSVFQLNACITMSDSDGSADVEVNTITVKEFLHMGLRLAGFSRKRIRRCAEATNCQRFRDRHGPTPKSVAQVWEEMQTTTIAEAFVAAECRDPRHCLMALHFVKHCDTESEREATCDEPTMKM